MVSSSLYAGIPTTTEQVASAERRGETISRVMFADELARPPIRGG
jgi:hypothetical protein